MDDDDDDDDDDGGGGGNAKGSVTSRAGNPSLKDPTV